MQCRLCLQEKRLCHSHIIPESAYGPLYDNKHRFYEMTNTNKNLCHIQKGLREYLLCKECEQRLNKYDTYFAHIWYQQGLAPKNVTQELLTIKGLDYHRFKLFHISVLWRAGIASREEFREVQLGQDAERMRGLIIEDNPGDDNQYPFFALALVSPKDNRVYQSLVTQPVAVELYDIPGFHFVFGGCVWHYILGADINIDQFPFVFQHQGTLHLLRVQIDEYDPVMDIVKTRVKRGWKSKA